MRTPRSPQPILQCCALPRQICGPSMHCAEANSLLLTTHTARVCLASADLWTVDPFCLGAHVSAHHPYRAGVPSSGNLEPIVALCIGTPLGAHMAYCLGVPCSAPDRPSRCRVLRCTPPCPPGKLCCCALLGLRVEANVAQCAQVHTMEPSTHAAWVCLAHSSHRPSRVPCLQP
ncbi:hypothetical protein AMTRI_Chr01g107560 [Amborella trichopoda]